MALFRTPVSAASQPANRYAERTARHPVGAPGSEQFSPACHKIVCGCRGEYRHPTDVFLEIDTDATTEYTVFSVWSMPRLYNED
jgi:hypothetical protein